MIGVFVVVASLIADGWLKWTLLALGILLIAVGWNRRSDE
jgi:hypothetical protein